MTAPDDMIEIDARGMNCPMPVIELAKALRDAPAGTLARLQATDSTAKVDIPVWCRMQRQKLVGAQEVSPEDGPTEYVFLVEKVTNA